MSSMSSYPNDYLTVKQAAEEIGCCEKTVRTYIKSGRLPAKRRGPKNLAIKRDDIHLVYSDLPWKRSYR